MKKVALLLSATWTRLASSQSLWFPTGKYEPTSTGTDKFFGKSVSFAEQGEYFIVGAPNDRGGIGSVTIYDIYDPSAIYNVSSFI